MATKRKKRNPPKGFRTWAAYMASIRPTARRKAARKGSTSTKEAPKMAATSRRRAAVRRVASKARSVARRARASVSRSGVVPFATSAAMDAAGVLAGKVVVRSIRARTPIAPGTTLAVAAEIALAVGLGLLVSTKSKAWGQRIAIGGMLGPMETLIKRLNVPIVADALGEDGYVLTDLGDGAELVEAYGDDEIAGYVSDGGIGSFVSSGEPMNRAFSTVNEFGGYVQDGAAMQMLSGM